jgi:gamma-glutamyl-gamma-aminobutyraldehyde dehydrogenase
MSATPAAIDWRARARALKPQTRAFIGGRFDDSLAERGYDCVSPIDGKRIASLGEMGKRGVDAAVAAARKSFDSGVWSNMAPRARKKILVKLAGLVEQHREELALLDTLCMGVPISVSNGYCTQWAINALEWYGEAIDKLYDEIAPTDRSVLAMITKEPIGVVGAVLPWNWPMGLLGWKVPPALAAGNSVVLKPDEQTSRSGSLSSRRRPVCRTAC